MANTISGMNKRRPLTPEEREAARKLSAEWAKFRDREKATQEWLGRETGLGSQTVVSQYLRGHIPLNLKAILAFCRVLKISPETISPELTQELSRSDWPFAVSKERFDNLDQKEKARIDRFIKDTVETWEAEHAVEVRKAG